MTCTRFPWGWTGVKTWVPLKPCTKGRVSQTSERGDWAEQSPLQSPYQSGIQDLRACGAVNVTQFSHPDSSTSDLPPTYTQPGSELSSWPQSELLTPVTDGQAWLRLESQNVLPPVSRIWRTRLPLTCWGKSPPAPRQQVYRKVSLWSLPVPAR